jgi:hypothetical protein
MNTNPDETTLALWLEDELHGDELAAMEAWARNEPEQLAAREELRRWKGMMAAALPASEEPPYAEFFNGRIRTAIHRQEQEPAAATPRRFSWQSVLMPLAACAGMALTFWIGMNSRPAAPEIDVAGAPKAIPVDPILYTPERGVKAEWFSSPEAAATVIVLNGVAAIPDSMDFSATAATGELREIDATAGVDGNDTETPDL